MGNRQNKTHKGLRYVSVSHKEEVPTWGSTYGGVYRRIQIMDGPGSDSFTIGTTVTHMGQRSDGLELQLKVELNFDQLTEIIGTLEEIRRHHVQVMREKQAWEKSLDNSEEPNK